MSSAKSMKVLILTIGNGINILINFLTLPFLVRSLSYSDYGSYGQALIVIGFLQGIFTFNLNQVANIYLAKKEYSPRLVFSSLMRSTFFLSVISMLILAATTPLISASFQNDMLTKMLLLSLLNLAAQVPAPILLSVLIFHEKVKRASIILILTNILKVVSMLFAIKILHSINYLMGFLSIVSVIQIIAFYFAVPKEFRTLKLKDKNLAKGYLSMATPLAISSIVERSVVYIDGIMISTMLTTTNYALYRAGAIEVPFVASLYGSVAAIVMPEVAKLFVDKKISDILQLKKKVIAGTVFFVYPVLIFLLLFSAPIVTFYLSEKYSQSALVFAIFNLSLFIRINDYQDVIIIAGKTKFIFKVITTMILFNLFLNFTLIKIFGIEGSALAFILFLFIYAGILTWKTCKLLNCRFTDLFNMDVIVRILLLSLATALPLWIIRHYFISNVWFIIGSAPIYLMFVYSIGMRFNLIENELLTKMSMRIPLLSTFIFKKNGLRNS